MPRELITHADKVFFAERGETKGDLAEHYLRVAEPLLRTMGGRPVLLQRFPDGASGPSFFQKRVPKNVPDWLRTTIVSTPNGTTSQALVAADIDHVLWAVNLGCLGFHVWPYLADDPQHTDELRIDLDPSPGVQFTHIRRAAHEVHALLAELGITGYPKTTGNRGVHVYVRLHPRWDSYQVRAAAVALARELERRHPALLESAGDPWLPMNDDPQDLEPLLDLAARDQAAGLPDAPWPPVYPKQPGELSRVAPSRAKKS